MAEQHSAHEAPGLPQITDEAGDTPMWVPILGLTLLALMALVFAYEVNTAEPAGEAAAVDAPAEPAEPAEPPAE